MYVVDIETRKVMTANFVVKFQYKGFEISATPRDKINVYSICADSELLFMALEPDLLGIDACKEFIDGL